MLSEGSGQTSPATLEPCREESVEFDNTQSIFIEGKIWRY